MELLQQKEIGQESIDPYENYSLFTNKVPNMHWHSTAAGDDLVSQ